MSEFNSFDEIALRLKQELKLTKDKELAQALGMGARAWSGRKVRNSFPEDKLYALAAKRPELGIDVRYVLTGEVDQAATPSVSLRQAPATRERPFIFVSADCGIGAFIGPEDGEIFWTLLNLLRKKQLPSRGKP